jgi:mono/diheme cytochrome c family protein
MRTWITGGLLAALVLAVVGCGADKKDTKGAAAPKSRTVTATALPPIKGVRNAPIAAGQRIFVHSGCLACHQLYKSGNSGPGSNLTGIGARMSKTKIRQALVNPTSPMPSYRSIPLKQLDELVAYLSALRESSPGGPPCTGNADCG